MSLQDVVWLFAVAARVVVADPSRFEAVTRRLADAATDLVPPESTMAAEAARLWCVHSRPLTADCERRRWTAAQRFCAALESLGQQMDLPPLPPWERLPDSLPETFGSSEREASSVPAVDGAQSWHDLRARLEGVEEPVLAQRVGEMLGDLGPETCATVLRRALGAGVATRSDCGLVLQTLYRDGVGRRLGGALDEVLVALGRWLKTQPAQVMMG